ncbi:MAG: CoB--CoM heterodisulfide reductase iron-sulfur subunit A family protein [Elusimicrobia bacterium]|nr:CoB--CoM heterodisulfide reductase iron-sulfur subunit A family protein [Elusimicrobiota bacterium]
MAEIKINDSINSDVLVVGGGIAGMTAAIEIAETGRRAVLLEQKASLGGQVATFHQYFPKLCPPACGMEINLKRIRVNPLITVLTLSQVKKISGSPGAYEAEIVLNPRFVNEKCTACGDCEKACEIERNNDFNYGLDKTKAVYLPHLMAYPLRYVIDPKFAADERMKKCLAACKYGAIELDMKPRNIRVKADAVVWAAGWKPYDAAKLDQLGFGKYPNVITNVIMERFASLSGPTAGKITRPSDAKEIKKIGFVQCAGSRDDKHLAYCSTVCCTASMKQAAYIRERYPQAEIHIFYIDARSPGRLEDFYAKLQKDSKVFFHRGKVGKITENPQNKNPIVAAENTLTGERRALELDMAVLATGMVPNTLDEPPPLNTALDDFGFIAPGASQGIIGAGTAVRPMDVSASVQNATAAAAVRPMDVSASVQNATAAAMKALALVSRPRQPADNAGVSLLKSDKTPEAVAV